MKKLLSFLGLLVLASAVLAADGSYAKKAIYIDLTLAGARTIRTSSTSICSIRINGTTGAGTGDIVLRESAAGSGNVVFRLIGTSGTSFEGNMDMGANCYSATDGLFMDALGTAWGSGSFMTIYSR